MDRKIILDYETRSSVDLKKYGMMNYVHDVNADIVCLSYKVNSFPTQLWYPPLPLPSCLKNIHQTKLIAFNAQFDKRVWDILGQKYGFPKSDYSDWIDVMAICGQYTFPQSLDQAAKALGLPINKDPTGKQLIKKITQPPFEYSPEELHKFYDYCILDTDVLCALIQALPADYLSVSEQGVWELTAELNDCGVPIDLETVKIIHNTNQKFIKNQNAKLPVLTEGAFSKITQLQKLKKWLNEQKVFVDDVQAGTVQALLNTDLSKEVREVLQMRADIGSSAIAKYKKMKNLVYQGRGYDNLRFFGAAPGRFAGMGIQLQNLPRAAVENPEAEIQKFYDGSILQENPVMSAKALIRPMIKAPEGSSLIVADYSGIENRILAYTAQDDITLELFRQGKDQYLDMAAFLFDIPIELITADQRLLGKILVLGAGYGAGYKKFFQIVIQTIKNFTIDKAKRAINSYREKYYLNVDLWYDLKDKAILAIQHPGVIFEHKKIIFQTVQDRNSNTWLKVRLLTGRNLYYFKPFLEMDSFGLGIRHWGMNSYTKKWEVLRLIPGRLTENIIQGQARDVLIFGQRNLKKAKYSVIVTIHDEFINERKNATLEDLERVKQIICRPVKGLEGLPLTADGFITKRYHK